MAALRFVVSLRYYLVFAHASHICMIKIKFFIFAKRRKLWMGLLGWRAKKVGAECARAAQTTARS
jgi:hypothetical protein